MTATAIANLTANLNFELTHTRIHTCVGHIPRTTCSIVQVNLSWPLARNKLFLVVSSLVNLVLQTTLIGARSFGSSFPVLAPTLVHHSCGIRILIIVELNDQLLFVGATGKNGYLSWDHVQVLERTFRKFHLRGHPKNSWFTA